uniref:Protein phosphatase 1B-like n=2 Tax=Hirondellea gigas TaxID=1518452 RepID=A0A2P2I3V6_9CRUS
MGALLEKPKTEKQSEAGGGNGLKYGLSSMQGWRIEMEDSHTALTTLQGELKKWSFFGVFDGHAGARVSAHCSEHLLPSIMDEENFRSGVLGGKDSIIAAADEEDVEVVKRAIRTGFLKLDDAMRHMPEVASGEDKSGTTAVCSLISPHFIFVANCGDSRGVLYRRTGIGFSTLDHKPFNPCEKERIQNAGGSVMIQRVNGSLAVSRALGDYEYKNVEGKSQCEQLVSPEPELYVEKRTEEDQFLVLACDGIWDVMTSEDVCVFIHSRFAITNDLELITNQVIDTCFNKGSRDNMSVVIVAFPNAPKVEPEAVQREMQLDALIETKVTEFCDQPGQVTMPQLMRMLDEENLQHLPPGGGLAAKQELVDGLFHKLRPDCASAAPSYPPLLRALRASPLLNCKPSSAIP